MRYRKLVPFFTVLVTIALLYLTAVVMAAATKTKTLISGQGEIGDHDGANQFSIDGGLTFAPAFIVAPDPAYDTIPGTKWISLDATGASLVCDGCGPQTTIYRTRFTLPATATNPGLTVNLFADNVGAVYVNGNFVEHSLRVSVRFSAHPATSRTRRRSSPTATPPTSRRASTCSSSWLMITAVSRVSTILPR